MINKKHHQVNHVEETENVKWCVFKVPQYIWLKLGSERTHILSRLDIEK